MATVNNHLKDKKIALWVGTSTRVNGIPVTTYSLAIPSKIWAYYKQTGGNKTITNMGVVFVNTVEDCVFWTNFRSDITTKMKLVFNHKIYEIIFLDDNEGYRNELKITCKLLDDQTFNQTPNLGIIDF